MAHAAIIMVFSLLLTLCAQAGFADMPDGEGDISGTIGLEDFVRVEEEAPVSYLKLVTLTERTEGFKSIEIRSTIDSEYHVSVTVDPRLRDAAIIEVTGPAGSEDNYYAAVEGEALVLESGGPFKYSIAFRITVGELDGVKLTGKNTMTVENLSCRDFNVFLDQESSLVLNGTATDGNFELRGEGVLDARGLECGSVAVYCRDASVATVNPVAALKAVSYGTSEIYYVHQPEKLLKKIDSFGIVSYKKDIKN